jgi:hypothetical protein
VVAPQTMGLSAGVSGMVKSYGQDQLMIAATAFAGNDDPEGKDDAVGVVAGVNSDTDTQWEAQGNSRIGARVTAGEVSGRFEYRQ